MDQYTLVCVCFSRLTFHLSFSFRLLDFFSSLHSHFVSQLHNVNSSTWCSLSRLSSHMWNNSASAVCLVWTYAHLSL